MNKYLATRATILLFVAGLANAISLRGKGYFAPE